MAKYTLLKNKETGAPSVRNNKTGEVITESENPDLYKELRKRALRNRNNAARDDVLRSLGLTKVRGAVFGKIYWE